MNIQNTIKNEKSKQADNHQNEEKSEALFRKDSKQAENRENRNQKSYRTKQNPKP